MRYKNHPKFRAYAKMTLHFRNADYVVEPPYLYFHFERREIFCVGLVDVSVGDKRLGFPPGTFDLDTNTGLGGCLFDTGALGMYFNQGPYDAVMKEFDDHFSSFGLKRISVGKDLRYCYNYHPKFRAYAKMTLHFPTADYVVEPTYLYFHYERKGYFCVGVFIYPGQQQKTIIGSWLQQDMRLLYDLNFGVVRFMPENCAADQ
ncbi:hypothetical protein CRG98_023755 [Punica granatum]|uniref:Xylanase inhibitor C-terminal domain-containing protein n=1 Tax=Punica granatum TaxID=22663 RepID=A0A2I0JHY3_PUNGR|nr:hypothetical protein CRG98_023755 [Punica granatum]